MFKRFYPTAYYDSAYEIDFALLKKKGYRGLLTDIDNTLVGHGAPANDASNAFFERLHAMGWKTCVISNNGPARVEPFAEASGCSYICNAGKPGLQGYRRGMELIGTDLNDTIFLGDQLFTDILGANRAGMKSILVHPVEKDFLFHIKLKRLGEAIIKPFCFRYLKRHQSML